MLSKPPQSPTTAHDYAMLPDDVFLTQLSEQVGSCDGAGYDPLLVHTLHVANRLQERLNAQQNLARSAVVTSSGIRTVMRYFGSLSRRAD